MTPQASLIAIDLIGKGTGFAHSGKLLSIPVLIAIQLELPIQLIKEQVKQSLERS